MNTIAIDCGASFIKGALMADGIILRQERTASPPVPGGMDILSPVWIGALIPMIKGLMTRLAKGQGAVKLCVSNEMHGFLLAYEDGTPFTDYISWQKEYGAIPMDGEVSAVTALGAEKYAREIRRSGMPLRSGLPSSNLLYLKLSGVLGKAEGKLYFYTLGDYIVRMLAGTLSVTCHPTNAAATGLYDLETGGWNRSLIAASGGEDIVFPQIGETAAEFVLKGVKVTALPAVGDQQAALLGAGLERDGDLSFNLGTGAQVSKLLTDCGDNSAETGKYQIRPFFDGRYIKTIPHLPSGRALNVYFRFLKDVIGKFGSVPEDGEIWSAVIRAERECGHTDVKCRTTFFENPVSGETTGNIENIGEYSLTVGDLFQAVFDSLAANFIWAAKEIEPDASKVERIIFSGGVAARLESVRDRIVRSYGRDMEVITAENETFAGLYLYGNKMK